MKNGDGVGLIIGRGTLKKGARVGAKYVGGPNSPHPRHVKEALHQLLHVQLRHPDDDFTDDDGEMANLWAIGKRCQYGVNRANEITTVNKKFVVMFIQQMAVNLYMDDYRTITHAPSPWKAGTDVETREGIRHNIDVIVCFLFEHDPVRAQRYLSNTDMFDTNVQKIYSQSHTFKNKLKNGIVGTIQGMQRQKGKAVYMHQFFLCQALLQEAECTIHHEVTEWTIFDRVRWNSCIQSVRTSTYGTCLRWMGVDVETGGLPLILVNTKGSADVV